MGLFDEMAECKVVAVAFSGGEPFLRPDLLELVAAVSRRKMRFSVVSNGTLITDRMVKALRDTGRLDHIQISIDSTTAEVHNSLCGNGSYELAEKGLKKILAVSGIRAFVRITLTPRNLPTLKSSLHALLDMGVSAVHTHDVIPTSLGRTNYDELRLNPVQLQEAWHILAEFDAQHPGFLEGQMCDQPSLLRLSSAALEKQTLLSQYHGTLSACASAHSRIDVLQDGTFIPCQLAPDIHLGRVGKDRLIDVWNHSPELQMWRERWGTPLVEYESCQGCAYIPVCNGGCPGIAHAYTGDYRGPQSQHCYRKSVEEGFYLPTLTLPTNEALTEAS
jgi:SynChlorMet cassette radical SAM/SPASM protein ScmE